MEPDGVEWAIQIWHYTGRTDPIEGCTSGVYQTTWMSDWEQITKLTRRWALTGGLVPMEAGLDGPTKWEYVHPEQIVRVTVVTAVVTAVGGNDV